MSYFFVIDSLSYLTAAGQAIAAFALTALGLSFLKNGFGMKVRTFIGNNALVLMLIVALAATSGSLFFSEIALFAPCKHCWFQRIFMYPQVFLLAIALWRKDKGIAWYILVLSLIGLGLAVDHYGDQWEAILSSDTVHADEPCDLSGVSCHKTYIFEFGYITIPLMAATAFLLNAIGSVCALLKKQ